MHRPRSREKPRRSVVPRSAPRCDSLSTGCAIEEGNFQSKSRIKLTTEHDSNCECDSAEGANSITLEFQRSWSKKTCGMPIKALIDEEMSREKHMRRSSPSLIARLMGLDTLPSGGAVKPLKEVRCSSKKMISKDLHEKSTTLEDCSLQSRNDEHQEFKDVFEVVQEPNDEKQKKGMARLRRHEVDRHEIDRAFIWQRFIDATNLSTGVPQSCKELVDAEKVLDLNKDIYIPLFQEPSKHLHDLKSFPSPPHAIHPSILMKSKGSPTTSCQSSLSSGKKANRYINLEKGYSQSCRKLAGESYDHASREHMCSLLQKLSESTYAEKDEYCGQPTQIVILKPNLGKARKAERTIPSAKSLSNLQHRLSNNMKFPADEIMELYNEDRARQKLHDTAEVMEHKMKGSREISKEITKQMRNTWPSERKKVSVAKLNYYEKDEGSSTASNIMIMNNPQTPPLTSATLYEYCNSSSHPSACPIESSVTLEARKRLSEQWKLTNRFQEMRFSNRSSSTLSEMLALSDNETPKVTLGAVSVKKTLEKNKVREDILHSRNHPLGISSKDGWKDDLSRSLPRSKSLPASSLIHENSQWNSRNRPSKTVNRIMLKKVEDKSNRIPLDDDFVRQKNTSLRNRRYLCNKDKLQSDGEEHILTEREIHVSSEELKNSSDFRPLSEKQHKPTELLHDSVTERSDVDDKLSVSQSKADNLSLTDDENGFEKLQGLTKPENNVKLPKCDKHEFASKEALINIDGDQLDSAHFDKSALVSPGRYKEADQPSPVSVLEAPFEEEFATGCFEKISADLQELRMQLRLLKQESANSYTEDMEAVISIDEDPPAESFPEYADMLQAYRDVEVRDYSYVVDILIDCEILKAEFNGFFSACNLTEYPVSLRVFEKLEKKYKSADSWSREDRKLLFDLTNSILVDVIKSKMAQDDGLVEEVWKAVVKKMKNLDSSLVENAIGLRWADLGDDKELVGRQLENMIQEDLLDELLKAILMV